MTGSGVASAEPLQPGPARLDIEFTLRECEYVYAYIQASCAMPLNIRNETVNQLVNELAARTGMTRTEVVHQAPKNELRGSRMRCP